MRLNTKKIIKWPALLIGYLLCQFIAGNIATFIFGPVVGLQTVTEMQVDWPSIIMIIIAESMALIFITEKSKLSGFKLFAVLTLVYWGTKTFLMQIEAAFYLNIWLSEPLLSMNSIANFTVQGAISAALFCTIVMGLCSKWTASENISLLTHKMRLVPLIKIAAIYVPLYLLAGLFLAIPLGGEAFNETYGTMTVPAWMPLFQFARGLLWALILWLLLDMTDKHYLRPIAATAMAVLSAVQLLHPNPFMLEQLRAAHLIEVSVSMAIFGWLAASIYLRAISQIAINSTPLQDIESQPTA